jgi:putative ABC transport system permease protein
MRDVPPNSHFRPDFLASLSTFKPGTWHYTYNIPTSWTNLFYKSYIILKKGFDHKELGKKLPLFLESHIGEQAKEFDPFLQPLKSIHLHSDMISEFEPNSDAKYVYIFLSVAFLILFVACINYMNLATARSACRAKEVGVRKTFGSSRAQLVSQFLGESVLTSFLAALVAVPVVGWMLPVFNVLADKSLSISYFETGIEIIILFTFALFIGLISGSYPALFLSRFMPVKVLKGRQNITLFNRYSLRKLLVVFQFGITLFLLTSTNVILKQLDLFKEGKIRFDRELVINIPLRGQGAANSYESFKNEILRNSKIRSATSSSHVPFTSNKIGSYRFPGILDSESAFESDYFVVDADFTKFFNLEIVSGRGFSKDRDGLSESKSFILNERAVRELGVTNEQIIGKQIEDPFWKASGKVVGVVKDFHYKSMHSKINPLVIKMDPWFVRFLSLKISADEFKNNLSFLKKKWDEFYPASPFSYTFLDDDLNKMYRAEEKMGLIFKYFSLIAILISCIGLYSLASFTTEQRTKEIGIRKVLGASVWNVIALLCKDFIKLVFLAFLIAAPVSFFAMYVWLQSFAYRTNISVSVFMLSCFSMLLIVLLTVGYQSIKAAVGNPVKSLRYE